MASRRRKIENHRAAVSLHIAWYNFVRVHETSRVTPAMEAGITDHVWSVEELVTRALAAEPCALAEPKKLMPATPPPGEVPATAKELPNDRGWLRVVQGGKVARACRRSTEGAYAARSARGKPIVELPVVEQEPAKMMPALVAKTCYGVDSYDRDTGQACAKAMGANGSVWWEPNGDTSVC